MNLCLERLQNEFANAGVEYEVIGHTPAYTAQEAAGAAHVSGYMFAKTTMVMADGVPALLALQAPYEADLEAVRKHLGAREVRLARLEEFAGLFPDSEPGAMPPLPVADRVRVYAESGLVNNDRIVFAAGCHADGIRMPVQDYMLFASPDVFDFARSVTDQPAAEAGAQSWAPRLQWQLVPAGMLAAVAAGALIRRSFASPSRVQRLGKQTVRDGTRALLGTGGRLVRRPTPRRGPAFIGGTAAGFVAAGLLDPTSGRRRRAVLRDKVAHITRASWRKARSMTRYSVGRGRGVLRWLQTSRRTAGLRRAVPAPTPPASAAGVNGTIHPD